MLPNGRERRSARAVEDQRLLGRIKQSWLESGGVYGYRKVHDDMRELGKRCGHNRVARLMRAEGLRSQRGYGRRPKVFGSQPAVIAPNHLARAFEVAEPNKVWVTDITNKRRHGNNDRLSAVEFERRHFNSLASV